MYELKRLQAYRLTTYKLKTLQMLKEAAVKANRSGNVRNASRTLPSKHGCWCPPSRKGQICHQECSGNKALAWFAARSDPDRTDLDRRTSTSPPVVFHINYPSYQAVPFQVDRQISIVGLLAALSPIDKGSM